MCYHWKNFGEYRATILQNYLRHSCHSCGTKRSFLRNKQREGDVLCISCLSLLSCTCLEWVDKAEEWLIPAFRLIRSNFWRAVMWNHCRITHTPENWREIVGGWLHGSLLFQQRPLRKNRPLGHHICVLTVYLVVCIRYSKWNLWNIGNYLQKVQSYYQKRFFLSMSNVIVLFEEQQ